MKKLTYIAIILAIIIQAFLAFGLFLFVWNEIGVGNNINIVNQKAEYSIKQTQLIGAFLEENFSDQLKNFNDKLTNSKTQ